MYIYKEDNNMLSEQGRTEPRFGVTVHFGNYVEVYPARDAKHARRLFEIFTGRGFAGAQSVVLNVCDYDKGYIVEYYEREDFAGW